MGRRAPSGTDGDGDGTGPDPTPDRFRCVVVSEIPALSRAALSLTRNQADAEDLVQETLLRAYRALGSFDGRHPKAWLLTIMRNAHINRGRRQRPQLLDDPDLPAALVDPGALGRSPEEIVLEGTFEAVVQAAFLELPENLRRVLELVDIGGLSYRETAEQLDIPVGTVMSRLHRARARIRRQLAAAGMAPHPRRR